MNNFSIFPTLAEDIVETDIPASFEKLTPVQLRQSVEVLIRKHMKFLKMSHCSADNLSDFMLQVVKDYHMEVMWEVNSDTTRGYYFMLLQTAMEQKVSHQ